MPCKLSMSAYGLEDSSYLTDCSRRSRNRDGFQGDDHEHDLLKLILSCAPVLKIVTLKLSRELSSNNDGCAKIYDIFKAYPSVECLIYLRSGKYFLP
jgi:hypothetical protein